MRLRLLFAGRVSLFIYGHAKAPIQYMRAICWKISCNLKNQCEIAAINYSISKTGLLRLIYKPLNRWAQAEITELILNIRIFVMKVKYFYLTHYAVHYITHYLIHYMTLTLHITYHIT